MRKIYSWMLSIVLAVACSSDIWATELRIDGVADEKSGTVQNIVFLSEDAYQRKLPQKIKKLRKLPVTQHGYLDPIELFDFNQEHKLEMFHYVNMDQYGLYEAKHFQMIPYLVTGDLCECVGVSILVPQFKAGMMHVGFKSFDKGLLNEFLNHFPKNVRPKAQVRMLSSFESQLFCQVYDTIKGQGFNIESIDVMPTYVENKGRTANGTKFFSYERLGITPDEAESLADLNKEDLSIFFNRRAGCDMRIAEARRIMIIDSRNGNSFQFMPVGYGEMSDQILVKLMRTYLDWHNMSDASRPSPKALEVAFKMYLQTKRKDAKELAFAVNYITMISMSLELTELDHMAKIYARGDK